MFQASQIDEFALNTWDAQPTILTLLAVYYDLCLRQRIILNVI